MPRRGRCVLPEVACHITQRGVDRCETFSTDDDRHTYLRLLRDNFIFSQLPVHVTPVHVTPRNPWPRGALQACNQALVGAVSARRAQLQGQQNLTDAQRRESRADWQIIRYFSNVPFGNSATSQ